MSNNSSLLCDLIKARNLSSEVSFKIEQLISSGANVNYQDVDSNNNTSLHFAINNRDLNAVKLLLLLKPDLTIKNNDDKTAEDLARESGFFEILWALWRHKNRTEEFISKSFIYEFELSKISQSQLKAAAKTSNFKILKITNCSSAGEALNWLKKENFKSIFESSSHLFVIIIEANEEFSELTDRNKSLLSTIFENRKPTILQIDSREYFHIFCTSDKQENFEEIKYAEVVNETFFVKLLNTKSTCNLQTLFNGLKSKFFGDFNGDILQAKLKKTENLQQIVEIIAENDYLSLQFIKLFDESSEKVPRFECVKNEEENSLALFNLLLKVGDAGEVAFDPSLKILLDVEDENGENLLMAAIERKNFEAFKILIKCGIYINHRNKEDETAADLAWNRRLFEFLFELLKADSVFPKDFNISKIDEEKCREKIEELTTFHEAIKKGLIKEVKNFIRDHPQIKVAYDLSNKSALTKALESKQFEIYSLLRSKEFSPGTNETFKKQLESVSIDDKWEIAEANQKYFTEFPQSTINFLMSRTRLGFNVRKHKECYKVIKKMYREMQENKDILPILETVENSDELDLVFDFNNDHVADLDPTKNEWTKGNCYHNTGKISIGAANHETKNDEIIGTFAHELTHYAMNLIYGEFHL
jgi:hypothetical protein